MQAGFNGLCALTEGDATKRIGGRISGCAHMQRAQKGRKWLGLGWIGRVLVSRHPRQPGRHTPVPRVAACWYPYTGRRWNGQRQSIGQAGQPALLVHDQRRGDRAPRETDGQVLAQTKQRIVPARVNYLQW